MNPIKTTPKDFFLHLGIIVCLYISSISLLSLLFDIINAAFPDRLSTLYYADPYSAGVRWAIASLIIIFPLLLTLSWLINKDIQKEPLKAELGIRKWLTYLTLFLSGLVIITDLVILINTFLGGEISSRFILKVLAVLVVTGIIFWYFISDLRKNGGSYRKNTAIVTSIVVLASIIAGFVVMGTPGTARAERFDFIRVGDLQSIQSQVISYYQQKGQLPSSLADLRNPLSSFYVPKDPETDADYTYTPTGQLAFKLCATFSRPSPSSESNVRESNGPYGESSYWPHTAGNVCFDRTIDPALYPVRTPLTAPTSMK